jgi:hypothetical protein
MATFTLDSALEGVFGKFDDVTQIRDTSGKLIGTFTPAKQQPKSALYEYVAANFDPEEIKRRKNSTEPRLTTPEVLAHLESLEPK